MPRATSSFAEYELRADAPVTTAPPLSPEKYITLLYYYHHKISVNCNNPLSRLNFKTFVFKNQ